MNPMLSAVDKYASEIAHSLLHDNTISTGDYIWVMVTLTTDRLAATGYLCDVLMTINNLWS